MLKNKLLIGMLSLIICYSQISAYANTITECSFNPETEQVFVEGSLEKKIKDVLVNLYMYNIDDGSLKYMDQARTDDEGIYTFNVDAKNRFVIGGKFEVKTKAQIEDVSKYIDADGNEYKEFYLEAELKGTYQDIINKKSEPELVSIIANNSDKLTVNDEQLKMALSGGYAQQVADIIKNDTDTLTLDNVRTALKKAALIVNINTATAGKIKTLIFTNEELLGLSENIIYNSLNVDVEDPETLNSVLVNNFCNRVSESDIVIDSPQKFIELVEDMVVISKASIIKGKDGINNILNEYSGKFDFTIFSSANNDKDKVLQAILIAIENKQVKAISDIQGILNTKKEVSTANSGSTGGSGGGSSGGGGGSGGKVSSGESGGLSVITPVEIPAEPEEDIAVVEKDIPEFNDISEYKWAEESIYNLAKRGVLSGYSDNIFAPGDNLTRAQLCKILCATFGMKVTYSKTKFVDIEPEAWYGEYVSTLYEKGFVSGVSDNAFKPNENIKRQDVCVIIYRMIEKEKLFGEETVTATFDDEDSIDEYAKEAAKALNTMGLISGYDGYFRPNDSISRAEIAVVINKLYEYRNKDLIG